MRDTVLGVQYQAGVTNLEDTASVTVVNLDLDVDSDNNNRYGAPDRSTAEGNVETTSPGKVFIVNSDDDDTYGGMDNSDAVVNGPADSAYDMAKAVCQVEPYVQGSGVEVALSASDYSTVRVFKAGGTLLFGSSQCVLAPGDFTSHLLTLWVEGLDLGSSIATDSVTLRLTYRLANGGADLLQDEVLLTTTNSLRASPLDFPYYLQFKDTAMLCGDEDGGSEEDDECPTGEGTHTWDQNHLDYSDACWHCFMYCTRTSVKMINEYYGGQVSRDRISYQVRDEFEGGGDLGHYEGLWPQSPLAWALSLSTDDLVVKEDEEVGDGDETWFEILDSLISYRTVLLVRDYGGGARQCSGHGIRSLAAPYRGV